MTDEHNLRTLGCYRQQMTNDQASMWGENVIVETPNIDKLASQGALFTNFYTVAPICTPSRASFMSGRYPIGPEISANRNHESMNMNTTTFAQVLSEQGYTTGYFGKWHLDGEEKPGWGNTTNPTFGFMENKYLYNRGHWKYMDEVNGDMKEYGFQNQNTFEGKEDKHYVTDYLFDRGIEFIQRAQQTTGTSGAATVDTPFLAFLSIPDPHGPNNVREPYGSMYKDMHFKLPKSAVAAVRKDPAMAVWSEYDHGSVLLDEADDYLKAYENGNFYQNAMQQYYGMVKNIDHNVGKLLSFLKGAKIDDETIVVFTSDHGDLLGEHGKMNKGLPYQTSAGVPFILRYPEKVSPGKVIHSAHSSIDVFPTILNLMNVDIDDDKLEGVDGKDFTLDLMETALSTSEEETPGKIVVSFDVGNKKNGHGSWVAAITGHIKLVISKADDPWLYDLEADPFEMHNFFDDSTYTFIRQALLDELYNVLTKYDIPIIHSSSYIKFNTRACADSWNRIDVELNTTTSIISTTCSVISDSDSLGVSSLCNLPIVQEHCPVTCKVCWQDSVGVMWAKGELLTCNELKKKDHCLNVRVKEFCPVACDK